MANLFWKTIGGTRRLVDTPFKSEAEFEKAVFEASGLLEDVFPLKRQVYGGAKSGIPDIIGIDRDGNICIVEMKNVPVDASIIPQVLQYAIWAETNPDSIKSLWLECKKRPENVSIPWDSVLVRIIVVAPRIRRSTLALAGKINYPMDLIEITRWADGENELFLVDQLEPELTKPKIKPVSGLEEYDEEFYKSENNGQSVTLFLKLADDLQELVTKKNWNLERKFNKYYCAFKIGFFNAFGIRWMGTKTLSFFFKLSETEANATGVPITKYDNEWKEAYVYIDPSKTNVHALMPLFQAAYEKLSGK